MARLSIPEAPSSYYPPRARWYGPLFYLGGALQRRLALDHLKARLPREMAFGGLVASFIIPSLGFYLRGSKLWGRFAMASSGLLILTFIAGFGYRAGNIAFGLLMAVHAIGFVYYCSPLLRHEEFGGRLGFTLLALLAIGLLVYLPARNILLEHWLVPLRVNGHVLVVQRHFPVTDIQRGDWIAYRLGEGGSGWEVGSAHGAVNVRSGMSLGPVLAAAGDRVRFSTNGFTVNGVTHALLPHMPQSGEVTLREKQWFVWPELGISGYGNTPEGNISATMLQLAVVSEKDYIGKPFPSWLGRRQVIP